MNDQRKPGSGNGRASEEGPGETSVRNTGSLAEPGGRKELPAVSTVPRGPAALTRPTTLQLYLSRVRQYPLLTPEEEYALAVRYHEEGDRDAAYRLVTANLRLVFKIALEFQRTWMNNLLDLIQEGNVGLMQAVKKFDPYKETRLSSYASYWIKAYILKFILDNWRLVKIGKTQAERKLFFNLYKEKERLIRMGYDPGPKLIAQRLNVKEDEVIRMDQRLGSWELSLEKPMTEDPGAQTMRDLLPAAQTPVDEKLADEQVRALAREKLAAFRATLQGRDREIFDERMLSEQPITLKDLGERYGVTKERVRQLENRLLARLRDYLMREIPDAEEVIPAFLDNITTR